MEKRDHDTVDTRSTYREQRLHYCIHNSRLRIMNFFNFFFFFLSHILLSTTTKSTYLVSIFLSCSIVYQPAEIKLHT